MTQRPEIERDDALVARWRAANAASNTRPAPDAADLALWLAGSLPVERQDAVEAALACDPELLGLLLQPDPDLAGEAAAPDALRARIQAVLPPQSAQIYRLPGRARAPRLLQWGAVAASFALVSVIGFNLGLKFDESLNPSSGSGTVLEAIDSETSDRG